MSPRVLLFVQRLALLVALGVSSALLVDYLRPVPAFCGLGSGCSEVRLSSFSHPLGVPLPLAGVFGFAALAAATLAPSSSIRRAATWLTLLAGAGGALLLMIQWFVLHVMCALCAIADTMAMLAALAALAAAWAAVRPGGAAKADSASGDAPGKSPTGDGSRKSPVEESPWPWLAALALVVVLPVAWGKLTPAPAIPREVGRLWAPAKINVVEFADFECPFCRELHPILKGALAKYGERIHLVRLNMPLGQHPHAREAARAYVCAEAQRKGDAMADGLFAAPALTAEANRALAASVGVSLADFDACISDRKTDANIDEQMRVVRATDFKGLPTVWIGDTRLVGLGPAEGYEQALAAAAAKLDGSAAASSPSP